MKKIYTKLPKEGGKASVRSKLKNARNIFLTVGCLILSAMRGGPGVLYHLYMIRFAIMLLRTNLPLNFLYKLAISPFDSVRYFEFDFFWKCISSYSNIKTYLDVSSPRLLGIRLLLANPRVRGTIINPDSADINVTRKLLSASNLMDRVLLRQVAIEDFSESSNSVDLMLCMSVIEHISSHSDLVAIRKMWDLIRPGGYLLLSVPCAAVGFEEYIDLDEYGLGNSCVGEFFFGQRFYDQRMLEERIFSEIGLPGKSSVFGERYANTFFRNREQKLASSDYPEWKEAYFVASQFKKYASVSQMPGIGVIAMEFQKK